MGHKVGARVDGCQLHLIMSLPTEELLGKTSISIQHKMVYAKLQVSPTSQSG